MATDTKAKRAEKAAKGVRRAAALLKQAADPTRLQILLSLAAGEMHVGAICETVGQSQPATSHHLALLRHSGLVWPRRQGKQNFYGLTDAGLALAGVANGVIPGGFKVPKPAGAGKPRPAPYRPEPDDKELFQTIGNLAGTHTYEEVRRIYRAKAGSGRDRKLAAIYERAKAGGAA